MSKGIVIIAHNSEKLDYGILALISGGLAKKNLNLPVSLITDAGTVSWLKTTNDFNFFGKIFENIIEVEKPFTDNVRNLHDGFFSQTVPFINSNRSSVYDLTPYDETLLIDSDFFIFTDSLNNFWNLDFDIAMAHSMDDIVGNRIGILDKYVSEVGIHLFWATTVMFKKNKNSQLFFNLVGFIKENYKYYSDLFRFDHRQYRNDISFSIAVHILNGYSTSEFITLPKIFTIQDKDIIDSVDDRGRIKVLLDKPDDCGNFLASSIKDRDVHIMNKQSVIRHKDSFLKLI